MAKAQIKMFETIGVLIVFFFLLVVASSFYFKMQQSSIQKQLDKKTELEALQTVHKALAMPELDCSFINVQRENCFDLLKTKAFADMLQKETAKQDYFRTFGFATITVRQIYPAGEAVVLYNNTLPKYKRMIATQSPILLYNATTGSYAFGAIEVMSYAG